LIDVLLTLIDLNIVALPVHDAVIVAVKDKEIATEVMLSTFQRHMGVEGKVKEE